MTKNRFYLVLIIMTFFLKTARAAPAFNLDVTDQNFNSSDRIVLDQDEIRRSRASNLPGLLATKANISISTSNVQPNSIYIRGGDSSHVLILVDGVPTYDASSPQRTINLFNLNLSKIKRIEVLKGSQSVLYGGQALSGVIKIETFGEVGLTGLTDLIVDGASSRSGGHRESFSADTVQPVNEATAVSLSAFAMNAQNNSPVQDSSQLYPQQSVSADLGVRYRADWEAIVKTSYSRDRNEISNADFQNSKAVDADDFVALTESLGFHLALKKNDFLTVTTSHQIVKRAFDQSLANTGTGSATDQKYDGKLTNLRVDGLLLKTADVRLQMGAQLSTETMLFKDSGATLTDALAQYEGKYIKSDFFLTPLTVLEFGFREESSLLRTLANSYQVGLSWNQRVRAEYSTGFKTPSLFQRFSSYGDPNLRAENSKNFSLSFDHRFNDNLFASLTYFDSQFENLIDYSFALKKYDNVLGARTIGFESLTQLSLFDQSLRWTLNLGYQEPRDVSRDAWVVRRALHSGSLKAAYDFNSALNLNAEAIYTGEKRDKSGLDYLNVDDYVLTHVYANYRWGVGQTYFVRVENVEGREYQTTYGFYNAGQIYKIGGQLSF